MNLVHVVSGSRGRIFLFLHRDSCGMIDFIMVHRLIEPSIRTGLKLPFEASSAVGRGSESSDAEHDCRGDEA
ncbi:hypothetical protein OPV22_005296 [Ensete ventricosum]|uniref:Uncharacterized protein n=1 Tax=Ensete ventricosum TaxID=4639 RepID=A0AAV8RNU5_ENSVE|nr:hypothetical protein OPV22_005296 [Ensete ventricosum]